MAGNNIQGKRLVVCSFGAIPQKKFGASVVLFYYYIQKLKDSGFNIIHLLILEDKEECKDRLKVYCDEFEEAGKFHVLSFCPGRISKLKKKLGVSLCVLPREIVKKINQFNPDLSFSFDISANTTLEKYIFCPRVCWLGDLNFQTLWYHALYATKESFIKLFFLPVAWIVSQLSKLFYVRNLSGCSLVVVSSKSSESILSRLKIDSLYLPYPWPNEYKFCINRKTDPKPSFLFFGNLSALGSRSALHFFLDKVYFGLIQLWGAGNFQIYLSGLLKLPKWAEKKIIDKPEIKYLGFVEDIVSLINKCHAVIVPIDVPVGNRSRIVTAMSLGAPVIAHKNTSLGNPCLVNNKTCFLGKTANDFISCMKKVYEDKQLSSSVAANAFEEYSKSFSPDVAGDLLIDEIKKIKF